MEAQPEGEACPQRAQRRGRVEGEACQEENSAGQREERKKRKIT